MGLDCFFVPAVPGTEVPGPWKPDKKHEVPSYERYCQGESSPSQGTGGTNCAIEAARIFELHSRTQSTPVVLSTTVLSETLKSIALLGRARWPMVGTEPGVSWLTGLVEAHLDLASRLENHSGSRN